MLNGHPLESPQQRFDEACDAYRRAIFRHISGSNTDEIRSTALEVADARNQLYAAIG